MKHKTIDQIKLKRKNRKNRSQSIVRQYLLTYFVVLFIPLIIGCAYYIRMISVINHDDIVTRQTELEHSAILLDTMLNELSYLGDRLAVETSVNSFKNISEAFDYKNSYKVYEMHRKLPDLYQINQSIFDYYIFFDSSDTVVNKKLAYTYKDFYELYLHEQKYATFEQWYSSIKNNGVSYGLSPMETYVYKKNKTLNLIAYSRPLMDGDINGNGEIRIVFEDTALKTLLPTMSKKSIQYIEDFQHQLIYYRSDEIEDKKEYNQIVNQVRGMLTDETTSENKSIIIHNEKYLAMRFTSEKSGLSYYMLQPIVTINSRGMNKLAILIAYLLLAIIIGILLSYHMSVKSATPINDILKEVTATAGGAEAGQKPFSSIKSSFKQLVNMNSDLSRLLEEQKPFIQNAFFNRLIYGKFATEKEAKKIASYIGFNHHQKVFGIVILRLHTDMENIVEDNMGWTNSYVLSVIEVINSVIPKCLYTNIDDDQVILMLEIDQDQRDDFKAIAEQKVSEIRRMLSSNLSDKLIAYGGNMVENLSEIKESYTNATYMFYNEKEKNNATIIWYIDTLSNIPSYPPQDFCDKLAHLVMDGDKDGLHIALEQIIKTYIIENNLPVYLQHMLLNELQTNLFRIIRRLGVDESEYRQYYDQLEENFNTALLGQIRNTLLLYHAVCKYVYAKKQMKSASILTESIAYHIDNNYKDRDLSLTSTAEVFNISEPYLSSIFKKNLGINFSTYMENVRIEKAKELLVSTKFPIGEIAEQTGYSSTNSFCRAFKRVIGKSASEFRRKGV